MEMLEKIWTCITALSRLQYAITLLILLIVSASVFWRYFRNQLRFGMNLRKKIYFLQTSNDKNLQTQRDKIKSLKLFNIEDDIKNISQELGTLSNLKENAVYIVGYAEDFDYKRLFERAENKNIPIIILAKQGEIKGENWDLFNSYIYCDVANTTNRLAVILLNTLKII